MKTDTLEKIDTLLERFIQSVPINNQLGIAADLNTKKKHWIAQVL